VRLGEIARVTRGVVPGNRPLLVMSRAEAAARGIEGFVRPILGGARDLPKNGMPVVRDHEAREVVIVATRRDVESHPKLREYLCDSAPRIASVRPAPIAATYVGKPRFVANPDGLVVTNALYTVTPRRNMTPREILALVQRLNAAALRIGESVKTQRYTPRSLESMEL
jgi:hypothetical protein